MAEPVAESNPYASPKATDAPQRVVVMVRINPRDWIDVGLICTIILLAAIFVAIPVGVEFAVSGNTDISLLVAGATLIVVGVVLGCFSFRSLTIGPEGLLFKRALGPSLFVSWTDVLRVQPASRREIWFRLWLRPGIPLRGSLWCNSTAGHYRIEWNTGMCYFPPRDPAVFLHALEQFRQVTP